MSIRTALWSDDPGDPYLYLIWRDDWGQVPDGTVLYDIDGAKRVKGDEDIYTGTRGGWMSVGFYKETFFVGSGISKFVHVNE